VTDPIASVVIPTFRRPEKVLACLEALARQTFPEPWEIVVVDDGSPQPIAEALTGRTHGLAVRVIRQDNAGPSAARNRGVDEARGRFIAFTDDDCRPEPGWLEALVRAGRDHPDALVGGTTLNGLPHDPYASASQLIVDLVYEHFNADRERAYFFASNNVLCARDRFVAIGGFDLSFPRPGGEDRDFCDRWRARGWPLLYRDEARIEHRHPQNLRAFVDLHVRYGRGAFLYQAMRSRRRSGNMTEDLKFHGSLLGRVPPALRRLPDGTGRARVAAALVLWQVANAAGFALEAMHDRFGSRRSA